MSDLIEELKRVRSCLFTDGWESHNLHSRVGLEILRLRAAIAAKDREIAEIRQRTIEECAKVADAERSGVDYPGEVWIANRIAAAIRSLGKEGSGE